MTSSVCGEHQSQRNEEAVQQVHAAMFLEVNKPQPVVLFELAKGWLTGSTLELGEMHHVRR